MKMFDKKKKLYSSINKIRKSRMTSTFEKLWRYKNYIKLGMKKKFSKVANEINFKLKEKILKDKVKKNKKAFESQ